MQFKEFLAKYQRTAVVHFETDCPQNPVVSVLVQTFQHKDYIAACLDSVLRQKTAYPMEIIVGDDDSTDGTREICREYARRHPARIRLILHHRANNIRVNGKPTGRFNVLYGLFAARGRYVAICPGDDYWSDPAKLQTQIDFLEQNQEFSGCFHNTQILNEKEEIIGTILDDSASERLGQRELLDPGASIGHTSSLVFRRRSIEPLPSYLIAATYDRVIAFAVAEAGPWRGLKESMSVYRIHQGGVYSKVGMRTQLLTLAEMYSGLHSDRNNRRRYGTVLRKRLAHYYREIAGTYAGEGRYGGYLHYLWKYVTVSNLDLTLVKILIKEEMLSRAGKPRIL
jgi:glycosyltransferase involved in cell wall biosynthesis